MLFGFGKFLGLCFLVFGVVKFFGVVFVDIGNCFNFEVGFDWI